MKYRSAAVAGSFYPENKQQLKKQVNKYIDVQPKQDQQYPQPHALIVPHAGYIYSGTVAGLAYALLKPFVDKIKRVIILCPNHRVALLGCALSSADYFSTPLGDIRLDKQIQQELLNFDFVQINDQAHLQEHAIEVQLPFLQQLFNQVEIIPIVVGQTSAQQVSQLITQLKLQAESDLLIISSDLSHFHPYQEAIQIDKATSSQILNYEHNISGQQACGAHAINGLLSYAKQQDWQIALIQQINSGDSAGDKQRVVGYGSYLLY